jgi:neutral ceramidase
MKHIGICCLLAWISAGPAAAQELQAGAARVDITPPTGYPMWGYAVRHDAPSQGVLDPLLARALVLAVGDRRMALVSLDLGRAPTRQSMANIRARVKEAGIDHLFLVASHTHHGPVLELDGWPDAKTSYVRQLEQKLAGAILAAAKALQPAYLGVGSKEAAFNRNRHSRREEKPVDRELLVLRVTDRAGKPIAHAVNYAAHATLLDRHVHKFSADYPGPLARLIEKETGAPCLFLQGAAGDLAAHHAGSDSSPQQFGEALAREVLELAATISCGPLKKPTLQVKEDDWRFASRVDFGNPILRAAFAAAFFEELIVFYDREYRDGIRPHSTTALLDGRIGFVGVSGEFFCGHSLSLKRRARLEHVFFLGYCNDYQQYFPTIEAAAEGGYGADPAVSPAEVGAGERIIDRALVHLYKMRNRLPNLPNLP